MASTLFGGSGGAIYMRKVLARAGVHIIFARIVHEPGVVSCCDLDNTLKSFWEDENAGVGVVLPQVMTEEERAALEKVKNSCKIVEERYQVGVTWKRGQPNLPDNRAMVQSRLVSTEKNLKKNAVVAEEYCRTIKDYVKRIFAKGSP